MVSVREILRGAVTRFVPTVAAGAVAILLAFDGQNVRHVPASGWLLIGALLLAETVGFVSLLSWSRYRLDARANVGGRRSVIAGLFGIVGLFAASTVSQGASIPWALTIALGAGAIAGSTMYWPWLRRRLSEKELAAWENVPLSALGESQPVIEPASRVGGAQRQRHDA
jgi:hypothetical protein